MGIAFWILCGLMLIGALAFWHKMKLWSVVIIGFNVMIASLFAIGLFQMVANILDGVMAVTAYYNDLIAFAAIFVIVLAILMYLTSVMTKTELRFTAKTDTISKWISVLLVVIGFSTITTFVIFEILPEKPKAASKLPTMVVIDFMSKGSLSPLVNGTTWNTDQFVQAQQKRDAAVYTNTLKEGNAGWKFDGDSTPNVE